VAKIIWPLIMVMVDQWLSCAAFSPHGRGIEPAFIIPKGHLWDGSALRRGLFWATDRL
jgi:hypothetical protein